MAAGFVEDDVKSGFRNVDKNRIDLNKGKIYYLSIFSNKSLNQKFLYLACYVKKLRSANKFVKLWPKNLVSLRQKCHDNRKSNRGFTILYFIVF